LDTKAKVKIGRFSRGGVARGRRCVAAADHDMHPDAVLAPAGILEVDRHQLNLVFGTSRDTSDFVADCLDRWWSKRRLAYPDVDRLLIDLDNGPEIASSRTPYHSKYNRVERCWGILENHWNGALLDSIPATLEWAKTMTWCGVRPKVHLLERDYPTGVRIIPRLFRPIAARLHRSTLLPKWSLVIYPRRE